MPKLCVCLALPTILGLLAIFIREDSARTRRSQVPVSPLEAPEVAIARFDAAAALLRQEQFIAARRALEAAASGLPSPYREQAQFVATELHEIDLGHRSALVPKADEAYLRRRADAALYLGDFSAAAAWLWRLAELDEAKFAADGYAMQMLRNCLIWSECEPHDLERLARLAKTGNRHPGTHYYGDWFIQFDGKKLAPRKSATGEFRKFAAYFETTNEFGRGSEYCHPRHADFLLRRLLPVSRFSDRQLRSLDIPRAQIAYRISSALVGIGDTAGAIAWETWGRAEQTSAEFTGINPETILESAQEAYNRKLYSNALRGYRQVAKLGAEHKFWGVAQFNVGMCLKSLGLLDEAIREFQTLIGGDVDDAEPVSLMQLHRNYRSSACSAIANCLEEQGQHRQAIDWLHRGHFKYRVHSWCGTCEQQADSNYTLRWARNVLQAGPDAVERELLWDTVLSYRSDIRGLGFTMIEMARQRGECSALLVEIDRRLALRPRPTVPLERRFIHLPSQEIPSPVVAVAQILGVAPSPEGMRIADREKLLRLRKVAQLASWRGADDQSALFRALIEQPLGVYDVFWSSQYGLEFDRWYARQAAAYFLDDRAKAVRWLAEHSPSGPNEAAWHQVLSAASGTEPVLQRMKTALETVVANRLSPNSTRSQRIDRREADLLRDMAFLPHHARQLLYARTKTLQEYRPLQLFMHPDHSRNLIELGR